MFLRVLQVMAKTSSYELRYRVVATIPSVRLGGAISFNPQPHRPHGPREVPLQCFRPRWHDFKGLVGVQPRKFQDAFLRRAALCRHSTESASIGPGSHKVTNTEGQMHHRELPGSPNSSCHTSRKRQLKPSLVKDSNRSKMTKKITNNKNKNLIKTI